MVKITRQSEEITSYMIQHGPEIRTCCLEEKFSMEDIHTLFTLGVLKISSCGDLYILDEEHHQ